MVEPSNQTKEVLPPITSFRVILCRIVWCFAGPVALCFLTLKIALTTDGWIAPSDLGFPCVVIMTVAARWFCFRGGDRTNTLGEVTTIEQLRRYSMILAIGGLLVWSAANVLGNHLAH